jgi:hypothetical protein
MGHFRTLAAQHLRHRLYPAVAVEGLAVEILQAPKVRQQSGQRACRPFVREGRQAIRAA